MNLKKGLRRLIMVLSIILSQVLPIFLIYSFVSQGRRYFNPYSAVEILLMQVIWLLTVPVFYYIYIGIEKIILWIYKGFKE